MNWTASDIAVYYLDEFEILGLHVDPEDKKFIEIDIAINDIHVPSIYNIIRWFAGTMGQTTRGPSVWCSKCYFFLIKSCKIN